MVLNNNVIESLLHFIVKDDTTHTIGVEFGSKIINVGNKAIKLQIW